MNKKRKHIFLLVFLVVLLFAVNYSWLDAGLTEFLDSGRVGERAIVTRVIDGDTIEVVFEGGDEEAEKKSVRLLGVNSPERGERYYLEAKEFLEDLVLGETVFLERTQENVDRYYRPLRYVFLDGVNVNEKLVELGYANYYFPSGKDTYYETFTRAWDECVLRGDGLCEASRDVCGQCIVLENFNYRNEVLTFRNVCAMECDLDGWEIKDEGRKIFVFEDFVLSSGSDVRIITGEGVDSENVLHWREETYVWTKSGDTLFLRDKSGGLVLWEGY